MGNNTMVSKKEREKKNKHKGAVIWLTGLPAAGKTTTALGLEKLLFKNSCLTYVLDGDNIRSGLNNDLGFSPQDREENIRRIGEVAKLFADAGFLVIVAFISPYIKDRQRARALVKEGEFIEAYIKASVSCCEKRDPKGNYAKARKGLIKDFTGVSAPYEEPVKPEIVVDTEHLTPEECISLIVKYLKDKGYLCK